MVLRRQIAASNPATTSDTATAVSASPPPSILAEIPLWDKCGLVSGEVCADGGRCICKDPWWSQCRVPLNGSWVPSGETWQSSGPATTPDPIVAPSTVAPLEAVATPPTQPLPSAERSIHNLYPAPSSDNTPNRPSTSTAAATPATTLAPSDFSIQASPSNFKNISSASNISSSSTTRLHPTNASAYANPLVLPILPLSSSATTSSPSVEASVTSRHKPAEVVSDSQRPSETSPMPNLACPAGKESQPTNTLACDSNMPASPKNSTSPAKSSTDSHNISLLEVNPDSTGTYLDPNATQDQHERCLDIAAHQYQVCWQVLNITGYINEWISFNQAKCDSEDMGFADCFLYIEVHGGANCTSFTGRSQCPSPDTATFLGRTNGAHSYYVAFNIWNIQNWFFTYYLAVGGANSLASDNINMIVRTLDLPLPKNISIMDILAGLAWGFGLLSPSGYAERIPKLGEKIVGFGAQAPGEYLLRAVQNSPTLTRNLLDKGGLSDANLQIAEMGSNLARITAQLQTNIQNAIILVMSNFTLFFDFVSDGYFSTQVDNINTVSQNVTLALNTYLVSQALQDDEVIITRALNTDVNQLQLNGSAYQFDTGCGHGYDEWGMCGSWWYDSTNHISYGLESLKDMLNNYTDALESLFNQGITTPELLFMNSQFCADAAGTTQGNAPGTSLSTDNGMWRTECISNMKICTWDQVNMDTEHEFTDCPKEGAWAQAGCAAAPEIVQWTVPASYIGPYLTSPGFQGVVCNKWSKDMGNPG